MLRVDQLHAGYGGGTVLHNVTLEVAAGTVHAVVGHNGAGKTSLIHTIAGLIRPARGRILLQGQDITGVPAHRRAQAGIAIVPQGRRVFGSLTVAEHLAIARRGHHRFTTGEAWSRSRVLDLLPQLAERLPHRGSQLSGGEQQMLAIARALLTRPRLLLLDEPTEGLAPTLATHIQDLLGMLSAGGLTLLVAAPQPELAVAVADHVTVLTAGRATTQTEGTARPDVRRLRAALAPDATKTPSHISPELVSDRNRLPAWAGLLPASDPTRSPP